MVSRAATATIKGYYYQFDVSILQLLQLPKDADSIVVEGIEDIDIKTATESTTVQCKYLSKPKFINSAVREPITLMLDHFISTSTTNNLNYNLYAHFEDEKPESTFDITLARLKLILTYTENGKQKCHYADKGITDTQLESFLKKFKLIFGEEFDAHQKKIITKIRSEFNCSEFEADTHFYNNALRIIIDAAIRPNYNDRKITKKDFLLATINTRKKLFNEWYIALKTKNNYLTAIKNNLRVTRALIGSKYKYIIIGADLINCANHELPCTSFIENLVNEHYLMNKALRTAKPFTIIFDCDNATLLEVKKQLIANKIYFNDGYEHIQFNPDVFNEDPIINRSANSNKIIKSSYLIRIIALPNLVANISKLNKPKVILHFSKEDCPYPHSNAYQWFDIKYCETLNDISKLLM